MIYSIKQLMKMRIRILLVLLLVLTNLWSFAQDIPSSSDFTENKGQWDSRVLFSGKTRDGGYFLTKDGFRIVQYNKVDILRIENTMHKTDHKNQPGGPIFIPDGSDLIMKDPMVTVPIDDIDNFKIRSHAIHVKFKNSNPNVEVVGEKQFEGTSNYFYGNDPTKWGSGARTYLAVVYKNIYPKIDIRFVSSSIGLKYDIIVHPGGNPKDVQIEYEGADRLQIQKNKLVITTSINQIVEDIPESYLYDPATGKQSVNTKFELLTPNTIGYKTNATIGNKTLVIDPSLIFSSFTGSSGSQFGYTATPGYDGSLYSGGISLAAGFPTSAGAFQTSFNAIIDISIFRFTRNGNQRMYATYIGGNQRDYPHSLIADRDGNLVILGRTSSTDFPGNRIGTGGGYDIVVCKLNNTGTTMIGSLVIGGSQNDGVNIQDKFESSTNIFRTTYRFYGDDSRSEVIFKDNGNILFVSQTRSSDFPMQGSGFATSFRGNQDGVVLEVDANCSNILWSSYLGGSDDDAAFVVTQHPTTGNIYVGGATASSDMIGGNPSDFIGSPSDGFISIISPNGSNLIKTVYLSTNRFDGVYGIQTDRYGDVYVMGVAEGGFTAINAGFSVTNGKQFVGKMDPNLNNWIFRSVWGSGGANANISPVAFMVDKCQNMYIGGWGSAGLIAHEPALEGTLGLPHTTDAIKSQTDNNDLYFIVISRDATELVYATFFGQNNGYPEHVDGGTSRFDQEGVIYMAVCANCNRDQFPNVTFPTSIDAWSRTNGSSGCNLAAIKIAFNFAGVSSGVSAYNAETNLFDTVGCAPYSVILKDTMLLAKSYEWQISLNGTVVRNEVTNHYELPHTFNDPGIYNIRLIAIDPETCNQRDTSYINVTVSNDKIDLQGDFYRGDDCKKFEYFFVNNSINQSGLPLVPNAYIWDFGDGTTARSNGNDTISHVYAREGNYKVTLKFLDPRFCNSEDQIEVDVRVTETLVAQIASEPGGCYPYLAEFRNLSIGGVNYTWDFGDPNNPSTSTDVHPTHLYTQPGTYRVRLIAEDEFTCNKIDTTYFDLTVAAPPVSNFSFTPTTVITNSPYVFYNESSNANFYKWDFGDNNTTTTNSMAPITHEYIYSATLTVQLIALNEYGCADTTTRVLTPLISPAFDVPNAFTPGRGGENSVIKVKGFGIESMRWVIYNRFGQKVFESTDKNHGWDGTFNGKLQPMDVYAYTLELTLTTGEKFTRTGDITLIR